MSILATFADAAANRATRALAGQQFELAERESRAALSEEPEHVQALAILGHALHSQSRFAEAEAVFVKLTLLQPSEPLYWMNIGTAKRCAGQVDASLHAFLRASELGAATADFYYNVSLAHIDRKDYESARALLAKAFKLAPEDDEIRFRYAWCCYERLLTDEALSALSGWDARSRPDSPVIAEIGHLLMKLGEPERAEPAVRMAVRNKNDVHSRLALAQVLERTNRLEEAGQIVSLLLRDPRASELGSDFKFLRAQLAQRNSEHATSVELFRELLAECKEQHNRHFLEFPLAKTLDAAGRYEEAYATLIDAHISQVAHLQRSVPLAVLRGAPTFGITNYGCAREDVELWDHSNAPSTAESPVFIVAFPRSGTTLLELALDAHPLLQSMDEQPFLQNALDDVLAHQVRYPMELARLGTVQLDHVRANYWERVCRKIDLQRGQRLVDKNPLNLLRLPLIKRLFPNAHILLAIRHPCDVIFSCFLQHFRAPDFGMLCRDLPTLASGYAKAFDFWYAQHALLDPKSREIRYETFVETFDTQIRSYIEFLELPWNDAVLAPGKRALEKRYISTPSYSQVVQPINKRAINRWRNYQTHLAPILPVLRPYLERWGYDA